MKPMKRILITGANGFTGRYLLQYFMQQKTYELFATSNSTDKYPTQGYEYQRLDLTESGNVIAYIQKIQPDVIIHTAAISGIPQCEENPSQAYSVNVEAVKTIGTVAKKLAIHFIQLSTDFVFDGKREIPYTEEDIPTPINEYGKTKLEAEQWIQKHLTHYAIARVAVVYGKPKDGQHTNIVEIIQSKLSNNEELHLVSDQWRTPTYVGDICQGIHLLIEKEEKGIFHICGSELFSIYELGLYIAKLLGKDSCLIHPEISNSASNAIPRPPFTALSNAKAKDILGYSTTTIYDYLVEFRV